LEHHAGRTGWSEQVDLIIKPYSSGDWARVKIRWGDGFAPAPDDMIMNGIAGTVYAGDSVIACGGVLPLYEGVGQVWSYVSDEARGHGRFIVRNVRNAIPVIMEEMNLHRVQATVQSHREEYIRFAKAIGLEWESTMKCAAPTGEDMEMFVKVDC